MPAGSSGIASAIAVWTSTAALSIERARSNCSVTWLLPVAALRDHRVHAGDGRELAFERARDRRRHRARIAARQPGLNLDGREVDRRQIAHRQRAIRDDAEQRDRRHQQARRDRPPDEDFGDVHGAYSMTR